MSNIDFKPAGYTKTTPSESKSVSIFNVLVNHNFIKAYTTIGDKTPNIDGYIILTDKNQDYLGKLEVQIKTLSKGNLKIPKYQCTGKFLAYCKISQLPVLLITADNQNKKVYWLYMDFDTVNDALNRIKKKSVSVIIPLENCIDGIQDSYINLWISIIEKRLNNEALIEKNKQIEQQFGELKLRLQNPTYLPLSIIKDIHNFLDNYNYILDKEFDTIKKILYPDYWKIGIGIIKYEHTGIRFLLYPVKFNNEQILVKQIRQYDFNDVMKEMTDGNILLLANLYSKNLIKESPVRYAYQLLEDSIMKVVDKYNFPIQDDFLAHEYLISFIDFNYAYLDMDKHKETYSLKELKYKLHSVLPMLVSTDLSFADSVTKYNHNIDSYHHWKTSTGHKKAIIQSIQKIKEGFLPKVQVKIISELYNIDLINYYINWLERKGLTEACRKYQTEQHNQNIVGVPFWKTWDKNTLWHNLKLFFQNSYTIYNTYIKTHFSYIQESLKIVPSDDITIVYILYFDESYQYKPFLEAYFLRPEKPEKGKILCFLSEDSSNPIDRKKFGIEGIYDCMINNKKYIITRMKWTTLRFYV